MKIHKKLLLLIVALTLSANFLNAQEFTIYGINILEFGFSSNDSVIELSFKDNVLRIRADGSDQEIDKFPFGQVFIDKSDTGKDYMALIGIGGYDVIEIWEHEISIYEYDFKNEEYKSAYDYWSEKGTGLADMIAVFKNEDTFMFTAGSARMGSIELESRDNAIIVSFNLDRIYNGDLLYDIQNVKIGTLNQTGERVVYGDISVYGAKNNTKEEYYITANKVLFGHFNYGDIKGLDFEKLYKKALEKSKSATAAASAGASRSNTAASGNVTTASGGTASASGSATAATPTVSAEIAAFRRHVEIPESKLREIAQKSSGVPYESKTSGKMLNSTYIVPASHKDPFEPCYGTWISQWDKEKYNFTNSIEIGMHGWGTYGHVSAAIVYCYNGDELYYLYVNTIYATPDGSHNMQTLYSQDGTLYSCVNSKDKDWLRTPALAEKIQAVYTFGSIEMNARTTYTGELKYGKPDGYGVVTFGDGSYWFGQWKNGIRDGYGALYSKNAHVTQAGKWLGDNRVN